MSSSWLASLPPPEKTCWFLAWAKSVPKCVLHGGGAEDQTAPTPCPYLHVQVSVLTVTTLEDELSLLTFEQPLNP